MIRMSAPEMASEITLQMSTIDGSTTEGLSFPTSNVRFTDLPADKPSVLIGDRYTEANPPTPEDALVVGGVLQVLRLDRRQEQSLIHSHGALIEETLGYDAYIERELAGTGFLKRLFRRISMRGQ